MKKTELRGNRIAGRLFLALSFLLVCMACNQHHQAVAGRETAETDDPLEGVWKLTTYYRMAGPDTTYKNENNTEHKIYLDGYVMWNHNPDPDSSEWHGFGTYTFENGMLTETLKTMSIPMRIHSAPSPMKIVFGDNSFEQVQVSESRGVTYKQVWLFRKLN